jgi:hypothetical protein
MLAVGHSQKWPTEATASALVNADIQILPRHFGSLPAVKNQT